MRKSLLMSGILLTLTIFGLLGFMSIEPTPVYSQDIQNEIPYLLDVNIYFTESNGEMSQFDRSSDGISRFAGLLRIAGANLFTLEWRKGIPADADLVIIAAPTSNLASDQLARLWSYLQNGGKVLLIADAFDANGNVSRSLNQNGIFDLMWNDMGIEARQDVVVEQGMLREVSVRNTDNDGEVVFEFTGELPELITKFQTANVYENHPITSGLVSSISGDTSELTNLNSLFFDGARSLQVDGSLDQVLLNPLVFTENSTAYGETDYSEYLDSSYAEYNPEEDNQRGDMILVASYENPVGSQMILMGDGDIVRNGSGFVTAPSYSASFVYPLNVQLMLRSIAWLLDREATIPQLPTPGATATATLTPTPTPVLTATPEGGE